MSLTASARHLYYHSGIGILSREELEAVYEYIKGFDLFGLIESGLAVDKTTINTPA